MTVGVFSDTTLELGRFDFRAGLRVDYIDFEFGSRSFDSIETSPSLRANFELLPGLQVFGGYGVSYRSTNTLPANRANRFAPSTVFPSADLETEKALQKSIGARFAKKNILGSNSHLTASVERFNIDLSNAIIFAEGRPGAPFAEIRNSSGDFTSRGVSASLRLSGDRYSTSLAYGHVELDDPDGHPVSTIRNIAAARGDRIRWDTQYQLLNNLKFGYTLTRVEDLKRLPSGSRPKEGYLVHDVRADWQPWKDQSLSIAFIIRNLTDEFYIDHTSFAIAEFDGAPEPGRDVRVELRKTF